MLPLTFDRSLPQSLSSQLVVQLRALVATGLLRSGDPLPSTRQVSVRYGVSRGTVVSAYDQLVAEGYLVTVPGGKTRVHPEIAPLPTPVVPPVSAPRAVPPAPPMPPSPEKRHEPTVEGERDRRGTAEEPVAGDLRPGGAVEAPIADSSWRESWRQAAGSPPVLLRDNERGRGLLSTRQALAEHLRLMRTMRVSAEDIFLTGGAREGLLVLLSALKQDEALTDIAVPQPGYPGLQGVIRRLGINSREVPVDQDGVLISRIPNWVKTLLITPNHLYPQGDSMPAPRRTELLAAVRRQEALVIEDDLDSEYRHVGPVLPSLWELAPDVVVHLGTLNRVLSSDVRLGYLIAPARYHSALLRARNDLGEGASLLTQRAVGSYLEAGGLQRRIIRKRRELLRRQAVVRQALNPQDVKLLPGGLAVVPLATEKESATAVKECEEQGVLVQDLAAYWDALEIRGARSPSGIIFDYSAGSAAQLETHLAAVRGVLASLE